MSKTDVVDGLEVTSLRGEGTCWYVAHAASGLPVLRSGWLRQRRFALDARADLLAAGVDFTLSAADLQGGKLDAARPAVVLWTQRALGVQPDQWRGIDLRTGEHYSSSTHYGQFIPSAKQARELAELFACWYWS